jgi:hypothetical protein
MVSRPGGKSGRMGRQPPKRGKISDSGKRRLLNEIRILGGRFDASPMGMKQETKNKAAKRRLLRKLHRNEAGAGKNAAAGLGPEVKRAFIRLLRENIEFFKQWLQFAENQGASDRALVEIKESMEENQALLREISGE